MSANLDAAKRNANSIAFTRRYFDRNRVTYQYHTKTSNVTFDTRDGRAITNGLRELANNFGLSYQNSDHCPSLWSLFVENVMPLALAINNTRANIPKLVIVTSGILRFDIFKGPFTKNDQLTASPYTDQFLYIPDVTFSVANNILPALNHPLRKVQRKKRSDMERNLWGDMAMSRIVNELGWE
ncbi:hypothetical protein ID866_8584 [Astraeus odoratus]|nr:hypothetical protein ID866_8584 [Astraeus odoratus]